VTKELLVFWGVIAAAIGAASTFSVFAYRLSKVDSCMKILKSEITKMLEDWRIDMKEDIADVRIWLKAHNACFDELKNNLQETRQYVSNEIYQLNSQTLDREDHRNEKLIDTIKSVTQLEVEVKHLKESVVPGLRM